MGGRDAQEDLVVVTKIYRVVGYVAAMAVEDEETLFPPRFLRFAVKNLFKLG